MKLFRSGSSNTVNECQVNFGFILAKSQILFRTASFFYRSLSRQKIACVRRSLLMCVGN